MSCHQLIYISRPKVEVTKDFVTNILDKALNRNYALQISGLLVYYHGEFMQLIEGDKKDIDALFNIIQNDPRHGDIRILREAESPQRCMPTWAMGFTMLNEFSDAIEEQSFYISCNDAKEFCSMMPPEVGKLFLDFMDEAQVKPFSY
jgi:hypothetical protein